MTDLLLERTVNAYNTAHASENKIHDDATAQRFGFTGGLVPGVDVYAYMSHAPLARWGGDWLAGGRLAARFLKPVYDGEDARITAREGTPMAIAVRHGETLCAEGEAAPPEPAGPADLPEIARAPLPADLPPAAPDSLASGTVLGTLENHLELDENRAYLADVREDLDLFADGALAHPGWLLRRANRVLAGSVRLGPWIHVASDARFLSPFRAGETLETRARVRRNYERKGHLFVDLDVLARADDGRPVMTALHTAIYAPRQVRERDAA